MAPAPSGAPTVTNVLLVSGLGPLYPEDDFYAQGIQRALATSKFSVTNYELSPPSQPGPSSFTAVGRALAGGMYSTCIVVGFGAADIKADFFTSVSFRGNLVAFVRGGGTLLFAQGERFVADAFAWFDKPWTQTQYFRTTHALNAQHCCASWYAAARHSVPPSFSVKACLLSNVAPAQILFGTGEGAVTQSHMPVQMFGRQQVPPGLCAVAFGPFGCGHVGFFGDVNAEGPTLQAIALLAGKTKMPGEPSSTIPVLEGHVRVDGGGGGGGGGLREANEGLREENVELQAEIERLRNSVKVCRQKPMEIDITNRAPAGKFQEFVAGRGKSVVTEHVGAMLGTRAIARLMRTAQDLREAGETTFKLWSKSGERMAKALDAPEAKRAAVQAKLAAAVAELGPRPEMDPDAAHTGETRDALRAAQRAWTDRKAAAREAHGVELRAALKVLEEEPRSPHLPNLPAGLTLRCLVPWAPRRRPPASCVGEVHLAKQADAGGKSLRCWRVALPGKAYIIGGSSDRAQKSVIVWDACLHRRAAAWDELEVPDLPKVVTYTAAAWLLGKLYVVGGSWGSYYGPPAEREERSARCLCWDPARPDDGWLRVADMPAGRIMHRAAALGGRLYVVGGFGEGRLDSVVRYDPETDIWEAVAPLCMTRSCPTTCVLGDKLYVLGGHDKVGKITRSCERYDPVTDKWGLVADMPECRSDAYATAMDGKLWVTGGFNDNGWAGSETRVRSVVAYDPKSHRWNRAISPLGPTADPARENKFLAVLDGVLHAVAAKEGDQRQKHFPGCLDDSSWVFLGTEKFNAQANSWSEVPGMVLPSTGNEDYISRHGDYFHYGETRRHFAAAVREI